MVTYNREIILIRNVPVDTRDVIAIQEEYGAQLFDEGVFHDIHKKVACAQVMHTLDTYYYRFEQQYGYPPEQVDIGDGAWVYIPIQMFPQEEIISLRTKEKPAGMIAWFRRKKIYAMQGRRNQRLS